MRWNQLRPKGTNGRVSIWGDVYNTKEYRDSVMSNMSRAADIWRGRLGRTDLNMDISEEERNDVNFRTSVMKCISFVAANNNANIIFREEELIEAIKYCPEGIKAWYNYGTNNPQKQVILEAGILERLLKEAPEVIGKLPQDLVPEEIKREGLIKTAEAKGKENANLDSQNKKLEEELETLMGKARGNE